MIADFNNMPHMFWLCNRQYFDHKLPTPKFGILHSFCKLARFEYDRRKGNPAGEALYASVGFQYANDSWWGGHPMKHLVLK